jgi:hypothetical protein
LEKVESEYNGLVQKLQAAQQAYDSAAKTQSGASKNVDSLKQQQAIA